MLPGLAQWAAHAAYKFKRPGQCGLPEPKTPHYTACDYTSLRHGRCETGSPKLLSTLRSTSRHSNAPSRESRANPRKFDSGFTIFEIVLFFFAQPRNN